MTQEEIERYEAHNKKVLSYPRFSIGGETPLVATPVQYEVLLEHYPEAEHSIVVSLPVKSS